MSACLRLHLGGGTKEGFNSKKSRREAGIRHRRQRNPVRCQGRGLVAQGGNTRPHCLRRSPKQPPLSDRPFPSAQSLHAVSSRHSRHLRESRHPLPLPSFRKKGRKSRSLRSFSRVRSEPFLRRGTALALCVSALCKVRRSSLPCCLENKTLSL